MASPAEVLLLSAAAVLAGAMNAIAGGGTILTFPALLAFGMPAVPANATSTVALLVGAIGARTAIGNIFPPRVFGSGDSGWSA